MNILIYIVGLVIGAAIFMYMLSTYESGKEKVKKFRQQKSPNPEPSVKSDAITYRDNIKRAPGQRICPLCGSFLSKYEALYASHVETQWGSKIMIYGCRYCYKPDEDPEKAKKSAY
jgi:hypothetical protein